MTYLKSTTRPLAADYDVALLDLDGVVYVGSDAVPAAPRALADARSAGMRLAFVTNNAARPPAAVADHLTALGIDAQAGDVITSAQTAAHYLAQRLPAAAAVLVCGTTGIVEALHEWGLRPVFSADDDPVAVLQGYSPTLSWTQLAEAALAITRGALWVATNLDRTVPSARGPLPGNGSMVAALRYATGREPISTGKPDPTMHAETVERSGAQRPLVVGDRLDTDIEGARAVGCDSLLVFSGVTTPGELLRADPQHRPDYLAADIGGLGYAHPGVSVGDGWAQCGKWRAHVDGDAIALAGLAAAGDTHAGRTGAEHVDNEPGSDGEPGPDRKPDPKTGFGGDSAIVQETADGLDGMRAAAVLCWQAGARTVRGTDAVAARRVAGWGIGS